MSYFFYLTLRRAPYHRTWLNVAEACLYSSCWYASGLCLLGIYYPQASVCPAGAAAVGAWVGLGWSGRW